MRIGVIGGSGLYAIDTIKLKREETLKTPFGDPSDAYIISESAGQELIFLPRHGRGHRLLPGEVNYRANIWGFKKLGVEAIISISAVGSLKEEYRPRDLVLPDQFFDRTNSGRNMTFFGEGIAGHVSFADPVCPVLLDILHAAALEVGARVHKGGTYLNMEGPAFSTRAESTVYRSWGMDIIGMTNMAEARLAREAEICYATACFVTDYDCWKEDEGDVDVASIIENLQANISTAQEMLIAAVALAGRQGVHGCSCRDALKYAVITDRYVFPEETYQKLSLLLDKYSG